MAMKHLTTTHEWSGSDLTVADLRVLLEEITELPSDARVAVTASEDQRDGNFVKFTIRHEASK